MSCHVKNLTLEVASVTRSRQHLDFPAALVWRFRAFERHGMIDFDSESYMKVATIVYL